MATVGLVTACGSSGTESTETGSDSSGGATGSSSTGVPTTGDGPGSDSDAGSDSLTGSISGTDSTAPTTEGPSSNTDDTQSVDPSTGPTSTSDTSSTSDGTDTTNTTGSTGTTDGSDTSDSSSSTGDPVDCVPTEDVEVSCDLIDNDCDDSIDNVDAGGDGICDCLTIGILGAPGFAPNSNFETWLEEQGSAVTRTLLANNPGAVTPAFLAQYDLILVDRIERALSADEAAAIEEFVKDDGRGMITLIGYNFDNNNPGPERDRANTVLAPFGLAYTGGYFGDGVTPDFDPVHPVSKDIVDVNFAGGISPTDNGNQGTSEVFATIQNTTAGLAHQTEMMGGRVIVWGDEWITFDSDWQGFADVQEFWVNMVGWAKPQDFCGAPQ